MSTRSRVSMASTPIKINILCRYQQVKCGRRASSHRGRWVIKTAAALLHDGGSWRAGSRFIDIAPSFAGAQEPTAPPVQRYQHGSVVNRPRSTIAAPSPVELRVMMSTGNGGESCSVAGDGEPASLADGGRRRCRRQQDAAARKAAEIALR